MRKAEFTEKEIKSIDPLSFNADPKGYAQRAIECLQTQLVSRKSERRKAKIELRIQKWRKFLEIEYGIISDCITKDPG